MRGVPPLYPGGSATRLVDMAPPSARSWPRNILLALGIALGLCGIWMLVPEMLNSTPLKQPFARPGADVSAAQRGQAALAAHLGLIRGDLWAASAFAGARLMWKEQAEGLSRAGEQQAAQVKSEAETALAFAPVNGAAWLLLALLTPAPAGRESRIATLLEMSYFTAPNEASLAPLRLERAVMSGALADRDLQLFLQSDIRALLSRLPDGQQTLAAIYGSAPAEAQPVFMSLIAEADPAVAESLRSGQPK